MAKLKSKVKTDSKTKATKKTTKKVEKKAEMIMKWSDLVPGDILQYNPEYIIKARASRDLYPDEKQQFIDFTDKNLVIKRVRIIEGYDSEKESIEICFENKVVWDWRISTEDGLPTSSSIFIFGKIPPFIIVGLAKE